MDAALPSSAPSESMSTFPTWKRALGRGGPPPPPAGPGAPRSRRLARKVGYRDSRAHIIDEEKKEAAAFGNVVELNEPCERCQQIQYPCFVAFTTKWDGKRLELGYDPRVNGQSDKTPDRARCNECRRDRVACSIGSEIIGRDYLKTAIDSYASVLAGFHDAQGEMRHAFEAGLQLYRAVAQNPAAALLQGAVHFGSTRVGWGLRNPHTMGASEEAGLDLEGMSDEELLSMIAGTAATTAAMLRAIERGSEDNDGVD